MKILVTGGGGFLGSAIVRQLRGRGDKVASLSRHRHPELDELGVKQFAGELSDTAAVGEAVRGRDLVMHVAARAGVWGPYREFERVNVAGTANVVAACRQYGVGRLVYTSTPSVVHAGADLEGVDESAPYPPHFEAPYPQTKAIAERMVLQANGRDLATVALRPHLIWGPGDPHLIPRLVARARAGRLRRIGRADKLIDTVFVDNAADAHVRAADRLEVGSRIAGRAYFIAQGEPTPAWSFINRILQAAGVAPVTRTVPAGLAYAAGGLLECVYRLFRLPGEPPMTRFVARQLSTAHWFDLTAARRDLAYEPLVSVAEGLARLETWFRTQSVL